ncbi:MAG: hypothetical protein KC646_16890 [Candidatus Cloacimonetes bacterium]|nr:hypothetical protein [Candidatus Cloacimonadota bacterium]
MKKFHLVFFLFCLQSTWTKTSVGIFLPENIKPKKFIKSGVKKEHVFKGLKVKVFSSFKTLKLAIKKGKNPDILIAPSSYFASSDSYKPSLQFMLKDQNVTKRLLCSIDPKWSLKNTTSGVVGIIESVGRKETKKELAQQFAGVKFKSPSFSKSLKSLISSIGLDNTNYLIISEKNLGQLKEKFGAAVTVLKSVPNIKYPMVGAKDGVSQDEVHKLLKLSSDTLQLIDMDKIVPCDGECK